MPIKTIHTSTHPDFIPFPEWFDQRLIDAEAAGDTAEVAKMQAAQAAVAALSAGSTITSFETKVNDNGAQIEIVRDQEPANVAPEIKEYSDLWRNAFGVVTTYDQV